MTLLLALGACISTLIGGLVALRAERARNLILGLAAGVMLGVVAFDLMPEALEAAGNRIFGVPAAMLTAALGFITVHILEKSIALHRGHEGEFTAHEHVHAHAHGGHGHGGANGDRSVGLLAGGGLVLHSLLDGLGIGVAFQADAAIGVTVAIAVIAHDFADGFNTFTITTLYGNARRKALVLLLLDAVAPIAGALLGTLVSVPAEAVGLYLGYFAGFLLYLASADILPEAHSRRSSPWTLVCTVAGMGFMWLVVGLSR